eukprot:1160902-Pelagomonas_calceolata.AAC.5
MPREKGPEWEYVTLVQPKGTDGVKQGKNKCKLCEHVSHGGATRIRPHFLQVPGCGVAKCTAAEDTWVAVDEDEEGGQQEEGSSNDGEGMTSLAIQMLQLWCETGCGSKCKHGAGNV